MAASTRSCTVRGAVRESRVSSQMPRSRRTRPRIRRRQTDRGREGRPSRPPEAPEPTSPCTAHEDGTGASVRSAPRPRAATASRWVAPGDGRQVTTGKTLARRPLRAGQDIALSVIRASEGRERRDDRPRPRACALARIPREHTKAPARGSVSARMRASRCFLPGGGALRARRSCMPPTATRGPPARKRPLGRIPTGPGFAKLGALIDRRPPYREAASRAPGRGSLPPALGGDVAALHRIRHRNATGGTSARAGAHAGPAVRIMRAARISGVAHSPRL